jgi:hypothetical protein
MTAQKSLFIYYFEVSPKDILFMSDLVIERFEKSLFSSICTKFNSKQIWLVVIINENAQK